MHSKQEEKKTGLRKRLGREAMIRQMSGAGVGQGINSSLSMQDFTVKHLGPELSVRKLIIYLIYLPDIESFIF